MMMLGEIVYLCISRSEMLHIVDASQCRERTGVPVCPWMKTFPNMRQSVIKEKYG